MNDIDKIGHRLTVHDVEIGRLKTRVAELESGSSAVTVAEVLKAFEDWQGDIPERALSRLEIFSDGSGRIKQGEHKLGEFSRLSKDNSLFDFFNLDK